MGREHERIIHGNDVAIVPQKSNLCSDCRTAFAFFSDIEQINEELSFPVHRNASVIIAFRNWKNIGIGKRVSIKPRMPKPTPFA